MSDDKATEKELTINDFVIKIVGGALRGTEFPIRKRTFTIGRSSDADIQVHDTLISRVHSQIEFRDGKWYLKDLNSTNGTWMAGQKVEQEVFLPPKTSVRVGKTIFELFNMYMDDDTRAISASESIAYRIQPETLETSGVQPREKQPPAGIVRDENKRLAAIYRFQTIISAELDENKLYAKILTAVFNVIPADTVYLLLYDLESGDFIPVSGRSSDGKIDEVSSENINKAIIMFVKEKREAVLSIEPFEQKVEGGPDLPKINISTMCVPLIGKQQINGILYLTLNSQFEQYTEDDLRLLTVIGHISGMAIEHSKMLNFNMKNERLVATGTTAAGLSHYIKNILAGLDGSLNLLRLGIDEKDLNLADEAWNILSKNHRRLGHVVLDLLNLASEQNPNFDTCNMMQIIKDVVELLKSQLEQEGIKISIDPECLDLNLEAEVDTKGIHRVILNLVTNAEEAILAKQQKLQEKDIGEITVTANTGQQGGQVVVTVTDNGIGMEKEELKKIFDLFVTSKGTASTGLGLAVCKRIVESHSGIISASAEKGKGCAITFALPVSHNDLNTNTISIKKVL